MWLLAQTDSTGQAADLLSKGGPYGVIVILLIVVKYLVARLAEERERVTTLTDRLFAALQVLADATKAVEKKPR